MLSQQRLPKHFSPSALALLWDEVREHRRGIDLGCSNPTVMDFPYPKAQITALLAGVELFPYSPLPFGPMPARVAVAEYLAPRLAVSAENVWLVASTSEAYSYLLKALCDPGSSVATGAPGYPLIQHLAELEGVRCLTYELHDEWGEWRLNLKAVRATLEQGARALVLVSPNNPVGHVLNEHEADALGSLAAHYDAVLIVDEVFAPFGAAGPIASMGPRMAAAGALVVVLDGLSKGAGLPQMKAGWMAVLGPKAKVCALRQAVEWVADAYLSGAAPTFAALPGLLALAAGITPSIAERLAANRRALAAMLHRDTHWHLLASAGGWYGVVRLTGLASEEEVVGHLARTEQLVILPGFFYEFPKGHHVVLSLLLPEKRFCVAIERLRAGLARMIV